MAQNITLMGASYSAVPAVTLPKTGGGTASFTDVTDTTATASDVASGKYFYNAAGVRTAGTNSGGGGGGTSWTLLKSSEKTVSTTGTSNATTMTITGLSSAWCDKFVYIKVRDKAGARNGYFYGSDAFFINYSRYNGAISVVTTAARFIHRVNSSGQLVTYVPGGTTGYGVFGYSIGYDGEVVIRQRYNSNYSLTINGTYVIEVYVLDTPNGGKVLV